MIPSLHSQQIWNKTIWAIGGGKGGTGKSFVSANLALQLSLQGHEVVLIDADFGGPNLHTFLGLKETDVDLGHFFSNKISKLEDAAVHTSFRGLSLIRGTDSLFFTANLNYYKKLKLIRHIKAFNVQRVIIDIGTGASLNNIDFFLLSNPGILVINPEPTSIENTYYFLKSCVIRMLKIYAEHYKIEELYSFHFRGSRPPISYDKFYADILYRALKKFKPCLIINKAKDERDYMLGYSMAQVVQKYLVVDLDFLGAIPFDENVHRNLKKFKPYLKTYPSSDVSLSIKAITDKLLNHKMQS